MKFSIFDLIKYWLKNKVLAIIILLIALLIGLGSVLLFVDKKYEARTTVMLGECRTRCETIDYTTLTANQILVYDYLELLTSDAVIENAILLAELDYKVGEVKGMLDVSFKDNTQYITINVKGENKNDVAKISKSLYESLTYKVEEIFKADNIYLVDSSKVGHDNHFKTLLIIASIILSILLSFVATTIKFFLPEPKKQEKVVKTKAEEVKIDNKKNKKNMSSKKKNK